MNANPQVLLEEVQKPLGEALDCFKFNSPILIYQYISVSIYQCKRILVDQYGYTKGEGLGNTADRLKKLDKSKEEDQVHCKI